MSQHIEKQLEEYNQQLQQVQQQAILLQGAIQALQNLMAAEVTQSVEAAE